MLCVVFATAELAVRAQASLANHKQLTASRVDSTLLYRLTTRAHFWWLNITSSRPERESKHAAQGDVFMRTEAQGSSDTHMAQKGAFTPQTGSYKKISRKQNNPRGQGGFSSRKRARTGDVIGSTPQVKLRSCLVPDLLSSVVQSSAPVSFASVSQPAGGFQVTAQLQFSASPMQANGGQQFQLQQQSPSQSMRSMQHQQLPLPLSNYQPHAASIMPQMQVTPEQLQKSLQALVQQQKLHEQKQQATQQQQQQSQSQPQPMQIQPSYTNMQQPSYAPQQLQGQQQPQMVQPQQQPQPQISLYSSQPLPQLTSQNFVTLDEQSHSQLTQRTPINALLGVQRPGGQMEPPLPVILVYGLPDTKPPPGLWESQLSQGGGGNGNGNDGNGNNGGNGNGNGNGGGGGGLQGGFGGGYGGGSSGSSGSNGGGHLPFSGFDGSFDSDLDFLAMRARNNKSPTNTGNAAPAGSQSPRANVAGAQSPKAQAGQAGQPQSAQGLGISISESEDQKDNTAATSIAIATGGGAPGVSGGGRSPGEEAGTSSGSGTPPGASQRVHFHNDSEDGGNGKGTGSGSGDPPKKPLQSSFEKSRNELLRQMQEAPLRLFLTITLGLFAVIILLANLSFFFMRK